MTLPETSDVEQLLDEISVLRAENELLRMERNFLASELSALRDSLAQQAGVGYPD